MNLFDLEKISKEIIDSYLSTISRHQEGGSILHAPGSILLYPQTLLAIEFESYIAIELVGARRRYRPLKMKDINRRH